MFCTKCGKELSDGAKFCTACGNPIAGQSVAPKKEVFQTTALTDLTTMSKQIHLYYVIAAAVCVVIIGIASYKVADGEWAFTIWSIIQGMFLPLVLIFAKKKHYENFGIIGVISFVVVICQLILALITAYHYYTLEKFVQEFGEPSFGVPKNDKYIFYYNRHRISYYFMGIFINGTHLFILFTNFGFDIADFIRNLFSIIANCICGIAFLHLSKFPNEEVESGSENENTEVHERLCLWNSVFSPFRIFK